MAAIQRDLILSLNAGSSSLKISLYALSSHEKTQDRIQAGPISLFLTSFITSISASPAKFSFRISSEPNPRANDEGVEAIKDHATAFAHFLEYLHSKACIDKNRIIYICHRVVHGGEYHKPTEITTESYHHIEKLSDLAPLHNGAALSVIKECISVLPNAKSIAYFDTSFHRSIPPHISSYAINQEIATQRGLKKYGFHGLSCKFILRAVSQFLEKPPESLNLILLHLGSGASACAVKNGKSLDTSMGLTPLSGLPGATRSGSIDPSLIFHYTNKAGRITHDPSMAAHVGITMAEDILNRKSGWKAIAGTTDFGIITSKAELENPDPEVGARNSYRLAFDLFVDKVLEYIGSYHLKLDGEVDALVFAGGIGEKGGQLRSVIGKKIECLGYRRLDKERNAKVGEENSTVVDISISEQDADKGRTKRVMVCKTDEQFEMARQCVLNQGPREGIYCTR